MIEYPPILRGTAQQQLAQLRDYLVRRAREEERAPAPVSADTASSALASVSDADVASLVTGAAAGGVGANTTASSLAARQSDAALRALILKTADQVQSRVDKLAASLQADFVVQSDFGRYQEEIRTLIQATARQIVERYDFTALLDASRTAIGELTGSVTRLQGQIRRGLIEDPETGEESIGIAVAESLRFTGRRLTRDGEELEELSPGQSLGLYTATGWQFWCSGSKRGWFDASDGRLHVRGLTAEEELDLGGDWVLSATGGLGIRYLG